VLRLLKLPGYSSKGFPEPVEVNLDAIGVHHEGLKPEGSPFVKSGGAHVVYGTLFEEDG
jgi:hypothetical protein